MIGTDDAELVARFAAGDEQAVRVVYDRYAGPIFTVAMSALGKRELAEDAVQTTMLKAWRAAASFDTSRALAPWLYTIARRVTIDIYRREHRVAVPMELDEEPEVTPTSFEHLWEAWEIRLAIAQLPPDEADVVRLAHFMGLTHREIAEKLELPLGTVKSRSARAHSRLATLLAHVVNGPEP